MPSKPPEGKRKIKPVLAWAGVCTMTERGPLGIHKQGESIDFGRGDRKPGERCVWAYAIYSNRAEARKRYQRVIRVLISPLQNKGKRRAGR